MKSQDIFLLLKLVSLRAKELDIIHQLKTDYSSSRGWQDWEGGEDIADIPPEEILLAEYTVRALADSTGISKSEVSLALQRCYSVGLAKLDRESGIPRVNTKALLDFIAYGLRYVFPAKLGSVTRGIASVFGAPVLQGKIMTTGDLVPVWPDAYGKTKGQALEPLYKTVPKAVRRDATLYALLALTDAIRIGSPRERHVAINELNKYFEEKHE